MMAPEGQTPKMDRISIDLPGDKLTKAHEDLGCALLNRMIEIGVLSLDRAPSPAVRKFLHKPGSILLVSRKAGVIGNLKDVPTVLVFRPDEFFPLEV